MILYQKCLFGCLFISYIVSSCHICVKYLNYNFQPCKIFFFIFEPVGVQDTVFTSIGKCIELSLTWGMGGENLVGLDQEVGWCPSLCFPVITFIGTFLLFLSIVSL